jgi:hypothetical protein
MFFSLFEMKLYASKLHVYQLCFSFPIFWEGARDALVSIRIMFFSLFGMKLYASKLHVYQLYFFFSFFPGRS